MLDNEEGKPTIAETYALAVQAPSLRVDPNRRGGHAVVLAAAGMNPHRLGMALRRLHSEWDARPKPKPASPELLEAMAAGYKRQASGLVRVTVMEDGKTIEKDMTPIQAAKVEADAWHRRELEQLFGQLKTLPTVRGALVAWAKGKSIEDAEHAVAKVLQWWLAPLCAACGGAGRIGAYGRTPARLCRTCEGTGDERAPYGRIGQRILGHMYGCLVSSAADLRERLGHTRRRDA